MEICKESLFLPITSEALWGLCPYGERTCRLHSFWRRGCPCYGHNNEGPSHFISYLHRVWYGMVHTLLCTPKIVCVSRRQLHKRYGSSSGLGRSHFHHHTGKRASKRPKAMVYSMSPWKSIRFELEALSTVLQHVYAIITILSEQPRNIIHFSNVFVRWFVGLLIIQSNLLLFS